MSESCNTFPTATSIVQVTGQSLSTTSTTTVTTDPGTTVTTVSVRPCPTATGSTPVSCVPVTVPVTDTIPGQVRTAVVPVVITVPVTSTSATTLFGSSCTIVGTPPPNGDITSTPPVIPTSTPPPVSTFTSESLSTQSNGSVVVQTVVVTSTSPPSSYPSNGIQSSDNRNNTARNDIAPIVGGAVGGFVGLIAIVALIWFLIKRRRRWDDIFETDEDIAAAMSAKPRRKFSFDAEMEPKPYQYGLVGKAQPPNPASPPLRPIRSSDVELHHGRSPSLAPLLTPMPALQSNPSTTTASSRPSTGGSMQPLQSNPQQTQMSQSQAQPQRPDLGRSGSNTHSRSQSNVSFNSPPVSLLSWTAGPSSVLHDPAAAGSSSGAGPSSDRASGPSIDRVGSPTSINEPRRLQIANAAGPTSPQSDVFDPYSDAAVAAASQVAMTIIPAPVPQRDGKGRLRVPSGSGKGPIVHLDGGRIQEALEAATAIGRPVTAGPSPPAYEA